MSKKIAMMAWPKAARCLPCLALVFFCSQPSLAQMFDPCAPDYAAEGYPHCITLGTQIGKALALESELIPKKAEFSAAIEKARREFWAAYPNGPGLREKQAVFAKALAQKDWYFKSIGVGMAAVGQAGDDKVLKGLDQSLGLAELDGGISPFARVAFYQWVKNLANAGNVFGPADNADYDYYVSMRNLAEFRKAGKRISNSPKDYLLLLLALGDGTQGPDFRKKGQKAYDERVALFGEAAVLKAARLVFDKPTLDDPLHAVAESLAGDNPKTMLLASFRGMNCDGGMNAQAAYDKMVAQFGERAVLDAATKASQLKRGPCGSSDKAVCVSYKWHMDDPPTKPNPQHYAGESDGTIYTATMLLLNPQMHTEKDVMYTKLHVTVPNAVGTYGVVHLTRTGSGKNAPDYGASLLTEKSVDIYVSQVGSYDLWTEAPRAIADYKSPVMKVEVPPVPTTLNIELKLDIPAQAVIPNGTMAPGSGGSTARGTAAVAGFLPRGLRLMVSTVDVIDLGGIDANRSFRAELAAPILASAVSLPAGTTVMLKATRRESNPGAGSTVIMISAESIAAADASHPIHTNAVTHMLRSETGDPVNERRASPSRRYDQIPAQTRIAFSVE